MNRKLFFYVTVLSLFGSGILFSLRAGSGLEAAGTAVTAAHAGESAASGAWAAMQQNLREPLSILLVQLFLVIIAARVLGRLFRRFGQPAVVGEMVAGILLGPSLLGALSPAALAFLFPPSSLQPLQLFSQIGVILFLFLVGLELDTEQLRERAEAALLVSHASIVVPFFLGVALSLGLYPTFAAGHVSFVAFALFMGIAMSITAFPVLARILEERGLSKTPLGNLAISCAAVDDVTAWCLLALVVAIGKAQSLLSALLTMVMATLFIGLMIGVVKPWLGRRVAAVTGGREPRRGLLVGVLAFVLVSAWVTETIGIHALFGAFLAGVVMPANASLRVFLSEKLETLVSSALLPLFFAFTGLRTQIGLLDDWGSWLVGLGILAVAVAGKFGGSTLAARWAGMGWRDALSIGALMNTRGLVELIVLNIGYDLGILPARIFAILVLMALVTTMMTGPLLALFERRRAQTAAFPIFSAYPESR